MAESGLTDLQHFISVMDVQSFHQTNLREIQDTLSRIIIKTKALLDNPIPKQQNILDLKATIDNRLLDEFRQAQQQSLQTMARKLN